MSLSFSDAAKAKQLREYFARHGRIYIVVDATSDDLQVPESLMGDPALRLVLNARMPQPIHIRDDMLSSDFSFGGVSFPCKVPMHTIWAAYLPEGELEQGIIWDDSVPEMIKALVQAVRHNLGEIDEEMHEALPDEEKVDAEEHEAAPPGIQVIDGGAAKRTETTDEPTSRKKGHLRVIK